MQILSACALVPFACMVRVCARLTLISTGLVLLTLAAWGQDPDCGSLATQSLVTQIVKSNDNQLMDHALQHWYEQHDKNQDENQDERQQIESLVKENSDIDNKIGYARQDLQQMYSVFNSGGQITNDVQRRLLGECTEPNGLPVGCYNQAQVRMRSITGTINALTSEKNGNGVKIYRIEQEAKTRAIEKERATGVYKLDTIRMEGRDATTKAVSCAAKLSVQIADGGAQMDIAYRVEITTDGKLYATVYGVR